MDPIQSPIHPPGKPSYLAAMTPTILVLGATGKTGRRLVPRLVAAGSDVRPASRRPGPTGVRFDWDRPETHAPALAGADAVFLVPPELVEDPSPVVGPFLAVAAGAGVARVVHLSALAFDDHDSGHRRVEDLVRASGLEWTILRPSAFANNFSEGFLLPGILERDAVATPSGDGAVAFVAVDDVAAVAAAALTEDGHAKAEYALTGPAALSHAEAAAAISEVAGRTIGHQHIPADALLALLEGHGVPADYAAMVVGHFQAIAEGRATAVSDDVERATGRPATSFADFARGAADAWRKP
jgi:uncharacterized protein YbjT (DUF2867 family)